MSQSFNLGVSFSWPRMAEIHDFQLLLFLLHSTVSFFILLTLTIYRETIFLCCLWFHSLFAHVYNGYFDGYFLPIINSEL